MSLFVPRLSRSRGRLNSFVRLSFCLSVSLSVCPSVTKTLTLLIFSEVLMIEHRYLACMILVTSPFNWHHAMTLTLTFGLLQGQSCCRVGDHNSPNLLVYFVLQFCWCDLNIRQIDIVWDIHLLSTCMLTEWTFWIRSRFFDVCFDLWDRNNHLMSCKNHLQGQQMIWYGLFWLNITFSDISALLWRDSCQVSKFRPATGHPTPWSARGIKRADHTPTRTPVRPKTSLTPFHQRAYTR